MLVRRHALAVVALSRSLASSAASPAAAATPSLHLVFGAASIPHPEKAAKGGEDAFFCDDATGAFGVADGVGGSARDGVDPGQFSRELLRVCRAAVLDGWASDDGTEARPAAEGGAGLPLPRALSTAAAQPITLGGSSTLLLGQLQPRTNILRVLNLGDSGAMLLRPSSRRFRAGNFMWPRVALRTHDQTHYFNCPYQVAAEDFAQVPARVDELCAVVRAGDVLVAATDGVLDNLFDEALQMEVARSLPELRATDPAAVQAAVDALAQSIARAAHETGKREDEEGLHTPFEVAASKEGYEFLGGKLDDVAVVCAVVREAAAANQCPPPRSLDNFGDAPSSEGAAHGEGVVTPTKSGASSDTANARS